MRVLLLALLLPAIVHAQLPDRTIHDLKTGRRPDDTSFVYQLPYAAGTSFLLVQGANSKMSHRNELSYDFKMKQGSKVCAARSGVVESARGDSERGGLKPENLSDGNYVIVRHADGSQAHYWHLQHGGALVAVGDSVRAGQPIGLSGNTGYTAFPHLHFQVIDAGGREILVRFATRKGTRYLRPGHWYKAVDPVDL
ncbi:MAG: M23 family metallopeptidase [Chitinophagaceae bacterium]|nr:MAG: M23 family metallopeptidase [Chitinophagaceae bacterium]